MAQKKLLEPTKKWQETSELYAPDPIDGHNLIMDLPRITDDDMRASGWTQDAIGHWHEPLGLEKTEIGPIEMPERKLKTPRDCSGGYL